MATEVPARSLSRATILSQTKMDLIEFMKMLNAATQRVVALVDMDCFYCQVEARLNPSLKGKPMAVVQYNQWKGGGIIAVNYEARDRGVTRHMRGDEAKEICPEIILVSVPTIRGKADLSNYRDAGDEVANIISEFSDCVQRASIDEAYLDLTKAVHNYIRDHNEELNFTHLPNTFVVGYCNLKNKTEEDRVKGLQEWLQKVEAEKTGESADYHLAVGAIIIEKMRSEILTRTGFHCSAGIAHNKILAKLTAGLHKPQKQTILPQDSLPELYETVPVRKVRNLGGKLGKLVSETLSVKYMSELFRFSLSELQQKFDEKTSNWLHNIARGIDLDPVTSRLRPESIGCCKNFTGKNALTTRSEVEHWLKELATEISERLFKDLERNKRRAKLLTVSFCQETSMTRCGALSSYEIGKIVQEALELLKKCNNAHPSEDSWSPPIKFLGLSASKFGEEAPSIEKYFKNFKNAPIIKNENLVSNKSSSYNAGSSKPHEVNECSNKSGSSSAGSSKPHEVNECSTSERSDEQSSSAEKVEAVSDQSKPSFFLKYLNTKTDKSPVKETSPVEEDSEEEEAWISLTEVFPDISQADSEVVDSLPEPLRKKFREKLKSVEGSSGDVGTVTPIAPETETCRECSKTIPKSEMLVHLDYHAALKLNQELNKPVSTGVGIAGKKKPKEETLSKRKKKGTATPSKKMKSLTAFFTPISKQ